MLTINAYSSVGTGSWYDISDYVISCDDIPSITRNHDFSLIGDDIRFTLSDTFTLATFALDDIVNIKSGDVYLFSGIITYLEHDYSNYTTEITIKHKLNKLKDYKVDYDTLHTKIELYGTVKNFLQNDRSVIAVINLLQAIFESCELELDFSNIANDYSYDTISGYSLYDDVFTTILSSEEPIYLYAIYMIQSMVYSINQTIATSHTTIDASVDYSFKKITCWDLVDKLCSLFGFQFTFYNDTKFYVHICPLLNPNTILGDRLSISSSAKYEYSETNNISENVLNKLYYEFNWIKASNIYHVIPVPGGYSLTSPYDENAITALEVAPTGKTTTSTTGLPYYNNLVFYWVNNTLTPDGYSAYAVIPPYFPNQVEIVTNGDNFKTITYTTDINLEKKALLQNSINIAGRLSEIQEEITI